MHIYCYQVFYTFTRKGETRPYYMWVVATNAKEAVEKCGKEVESATGLAAGHRVAVRDGCKPERRREKLRYFYETFPQDMAGVRF